jgi:hypothetical protein
MLAWLRRLRLWAHDSGVPGDRRPLRERLTVFIGLKGRF